MIAKTSEEIIALMNNVIEVIEKQSLNEIRWHKTTAPLNPTHTINVDTLTDATIIYTGKKYKLHYIKVVTGPSVVRGTYMVISDMNNKQLFFQKVLLQPNSNRTLKLTNRMNNTKTPLFEKLICTLLNLGFGVVDDANHNDNSIRSIRRMIDNGNIDVYVNGKFVHFEEWEELIKINDLTITWEYRWSGRGSLPLLEAYPLWEGQDAFEGVDNHFDLNESFDELFKEQE